MAQEIERKFLVRSDAWRADASAVRIRQGYLSASAARSVRVRTAGARATLAVKGAKTGPRVLEFEYPIPRRDALEMLDRLCRRPLIDKTRHRIRGPGGRLWEVDEFHAENAGLVVAEIELSHGKEEFARPDWLGAEVTDDPRYLNANLAERPFATWGRQAAPSSAADPPREDPAPAPPPARAPSRRSPASAPRRRKGR